ncbi:VOC family protein [Streptomyces albidoflavus]
MTDDTAKFHFTKVLVTDPEAQAAFYCSVLAMREKYRVGADDEGTEPKEIVLASSHGGDPALGLQRRAPGPAPEPGECLLGFTVPDLEAALRRAEQAGGTVDRPPGRVPGFGVSVAFVLDPEGHRLELVERH